MEVRKTIGESMKKCHNKLFKTKLPGVSLVELLVVSAITVMVMLTIARLFQRSMRDAVSARELESAEKILGDMVSELRRTNFLFVMPADSRQQAGKYSHNSGFTDYFIPWARSPMQPTLIRFQNTIRSAGFTSFSIEVAVLIRRTASQDSVFDPNLFFLNDGSGRDQRDPNVRFVDQDSPASPVDYWSVVWDPVTNQWVSDFPITNARNVKLSLFKETTQPIATREFLLVRGEMSSDSLDNPQERLPLILDWPPVAGTDWQLFGMKYHQRKTPAEITSLDLNIVRNPPGRFGLPPCREKRFDDQPGGGFIVHGITAPGATVTLTHLGRFYPPGVSSAYTPQTDANETITPSNAPYHKTLTADGSGQFLWETDPPWGTMVLTEWGGQTHDPDGGGPAPAEPYLKWNYSSGVFARAIKGTLKSQRADVRTNYMFHYAPGSVLTVWQGPVVVSDFQPQGATVKTLAPDIFFTSSRLADSSTVNISVNGTNRKIWYEYHEVEQWNTDVNNSSLHAVVNTEGQYANLPMILTNNTSYTVVGDFADLACYKAKRQWTFTVSLDADGTPPDISDTTLFPEKGGQTRPQGFMRCSIVDPESGVNYKTIKLTVDGVVVIPAGGVTRDTYNPLTGELSYPLVKLSTGWHNITVEASNFQGLSVTKNDWSFRVY